MKAIWIWVVNLVKKHWILSICLISIFAFIGIPSLINLLFEYDSGISFFQAKWTAADALGYYGSVLSFMGTVILGVLALYQNNLIKEESDKRSNLIEQREHERNMPRFTVSPEYANGSASNLRISIANISENNAIDIKLFDICISSSENEIYWKRSSTYRYNCIPANGSVKLQLNNGPIRGDGHVFSMKMTCNDKYNEAHIYAIRGIYYSKDNLPKFTIVETKQI